MKDIQGQNQITTRHQSVEEKEKLSKSTVPVLNQNFDVKSLTDCTMVKYHRPPMKKKSTKKMTKKKMVPKFRSGPKLSRVKRKSYFAAQLLSKLLHYGLILIFVINLMSGVGASEPRKKYQSSESEFDDHDQSEIDFSNSVKNMERMVKMKKFYENATKDKEDDKEDDEEEDEEDHEEEYNLPNQAKSDARNSNNNNHEESILIGNETFLKTIAREILENQNDASIRSYLIDHQFIILVLHSLIMPFPMAFNKIQLHVPEGILNLISLIQQLAVFKEFKSEKLKYLLFILSGLIQLVVSYTMMLNSMIDKDTTPLCMALGFVVLALNLYKWHIFSILNNVYTIWKKDD